MANNIKEIRSPKTLKQYEKLIKAGKNHYEKSNFAEALRYFSKALDFKGYHPNTLILMARCLFGLGMKNKAINLLEHALEQSAENPAICESLGSACLSMEFTELAVKFFTLYCQLAPSEPIGYNNLATALRENGQIDESIQLLQEVLPIYSENAYLWNSLGAAVSFRDGYPAALPFYEEAFRLDPKIALFASNLCLVYANLGQLEKAWEFAKETVKLAPNAAYSHRALAHSSYTIGKFDDGFDALAWHNHPSDPGAVFMPYQIDKWQGQDLKDKTILIGAEQGIGDEILMSSLYPALIREAGHVIIGCDKRLVPLFQNSFKGATVLPYITGQHDAGYNVRLYDGIEPEKIDYMCLYTELMRYKWRSLDDIPDMTGGFLIPPKDKTAYWKEKLSSLPHKINIGICWRSGLQQAKRNMFYADLIEWLPILKTKDVNFINVQYGESADEIKHLSDTHGITLHNFEELDLKDDFEGTAALMKNLDLVMGPGSSPVIQAAATGTEAWWVLYNTTGWWNFGIKNGNPIFPTYNMTIKPATLKWTEFMPLFVKEKFSPWVLKKLDELQKK
ncbi:hypothetical protein MNBD_ALPHA03-1904 [hydrothermal vent metagenome]|uniref:Uncharacterized protein n=1 Tax=hydrothermal vent metagenome TaxID=652676 RepID=A0A3B1B3Y9_9ZZZZ